MLQLYGFDDGEGYPDSKIIGDSRTVIQWAIETYITTLLQKVNFVVKLHLSRIKQV